MSPSELAHLGSGSGEREMRQCALITGIADLSPLTRSQHLFFTSHPPTYYIVPSSSRQVFVQPVLVSFNSQTFLV